MDQLLEDKLVLVQFLDVLALSILMPSVPPTILKTGGTLMHLGLLMSISAVVKLLSSKIYEELLKISGKRLLLKYTLLINCTLNALLFFTSSFHGIILNRVLFMLFNQVSHISSQIISKDDKNKSVLKNPLTQRMIGGLSGCAIVGSMIDSKGGFYVLVVLATSISAVAAVIASREEPKEKVKEKNLSLSQTVVVLKKTMDSTIKEIRDVDIHFANWDALLIKSLLIINAKVVFILFVVLIIFVFQGKGSLVNATAAYQMIVLALSGVAFEKINLRVNNLTSPKKILEVSLISCSVFGLLQSCSPSYSFYLLMFAPFVVSRAFVEHYFKEVFEVRKNQKLSSDLETVTTITEIVGPLFIGFLFHLLKYNAYRLLTVIPFIAIYFIVSKKVYKEVKVEKVVKDKKEKNLSDKDK